MSAWACWNRELVAQQLQQWGFQPTVKVSLPSNHTSSFIASRDQVLMLAIRGTSSVKNFVTDGNFLRVAADHGKGMRGLAALAATWPPSSAKVLHLSKLYCRFAAMKAGKPTHLLQAAYHDEERGMRVRFSPTVCTPALRAVASGHPRECHQRAGWERG